MENKYFIPDIEDIHAGYECELLIFTKWEPNTVKPYTELRSVGKCIEDKVIRVPYLTKEQIIAEGYLQTNRRFHYEESGIVYTITENEFIKENIEVIYTEGCNDMVIVDYDVAEYGNLGTIYMGECKDINTFRKIIKLLGI